MDEKRQQDLEQLNAFVDGELDVEARAEVTGQAANDPDYARELAALSRLKATLAEMVPVPDIDPPQPPARHRFRRAAMAAAASLVLFAMAGIGWNAYENRIRPISDISLQWSIEAHRTWAPHPPGGVSAAVPRPASAALHPTVPDLSANGLELAYAGERKAPGGEDALIIGYLGSRGCRLTMLIHQAGTVSLTDPVALETGAIRASFWRAGSVRYALLAEGMAPSRFRLIANSVRRASFERLPLDQSTRAALAQNRANSPRCRA